jgi:hypothetical protein
MSALLELAAQCEALRRGDRWLDEKIALACIGGQVRIETRLGVNGRTPGRTVWRVMGKARPFLKFTASLDAAMTLVPEGWAIERWQIWPGQPVTLSLLETRLSPGGERYRGGGEAMAHSSARTPALALTAACLRALASVAGARSDETLLGLGPEAARAARSEAKGDAQTLSQPLSGDST